MINAEFYISAFSGMALMLFSMRWFSTGLQSLFSGSVKKLVYLIGPTYISSFPVGILISFLIQSSTSTSVMAVSYAQSRLINMNQLMGLLSGAFIGTSFTAFLFLYSSKPVALTLLTIGVLPMMYFTHPKISAFGKVVFSLGLLFLGFTIAGESFNFLPLSFVELMYLSGGALKYGLVFGFLVLSCCIRSSVTLVGMVYLLKVMFGLNFEFALLLIVSINLGKLIPMIFLSRQLGYVVKRGVFIFYVTSLINALLYFSFQYELLGALIFLNIGSGDVFLLHALYNLTAVVINFVLFGMMLKLAEKFFPFKKLPQKLEFVGSTSHLSPILAIEQAYQEVRKLAATTDNSLQLTTILIANEDEEAEEKINKYEVVADNMQKEVFEFLSRVKEVNLTKKQAEEIRAISRMASELESITDHCKKIALSILHIRKINVTLDPELFGELNKCLGMITSSYEYVFSLVTGTEVEKSNAKKIEDAKLQNQIEILRETFLTWVREGAKSDYEVNAAEKVEDIIFSFKQLRSRIENVGQAHELL